MEHSVWFPVFISIVSEYLNQVDLEEERENQELSAKTELAGGAAEARSVPLLLEKLLVPGQVPLYYCGGFAILSEAITNCEFSLVFLPLNLSIHLIYRSIHVIHICKSQLLI